MADEHGALNDDHAAGAGRREGKDDADSARAAAARPAAIVASSADAILTESGAGVITSWNRSAERLYGYRDEEAVGRPSSLLIPPDLRDEELAILRRVLGGERVAHYDTQRVAKDGTVIDVSLTMSPVRDRTGAIVEASVIVRDVTQTRRSERQRERLQAMTAALSGTLSAAEVVEVVLGQGFAAVEADAAVVALRVPASSRLRLIGLRGYAPATAARMQEMTVEDDLPLSETLRTGRPVWLADAAEAALRYPRSSEFELEPGAALAAVPLDVHGSTIGALGLRLRRSRPVAEDEQRFMLTLAQQCAQALERARLFEAEQDARRRAEYLANAGALLADSLSPQATLDQVARLAVPELADWAFVELLRPDGAIVRESIVHRDPEKERWARTLAERYPLDPAADHGSARVIRTGVPELLPEISDELLEAAAVDDEQLEILRTIGFASGMVVPLIARGRVLGDIALASAESGRRFGADDLVMAQQLADRCALALDNARLFAERSYIAKTLQEGLLPSGLPEIPRVELAVRYRAATQEADVGGDFYDVFAAGGGWMFVTGDVVGKGAKAAAITGLARHTLRAAALYEQSPAAMLRVLNRAMLNEFTDPEQFCTVAVAHLRGDELRIASGGHPLPLVLRADGSVDAAGRPGSLVGVLEDPPLHECAVPVGAGDTVVLYTDGVTDALGAGGRFGAERLEAVLALSTAMAPAQIVDRIDRAVSAYRVGEPTDDSAIVAFRLHGP